MPLPLRTNRLLLRPLRIEETAARRDDAVVPLTAREPPGTLTGVVTPRDGRQSVAMRAMKGKVASQDGVPIHYEVHGRGAPALVFVHGWSCDRTYWRHQIEPFAARHQVVTIDLAGHGESGQGRSSWTMPAFGGDVTAVVDELGLDELVLIGHSMGGDVIVEAGLQLPGRLVGLVWVDTYRRLGNVRSSQEIQAFLAPFREDFAAATQRLVRGMFVPGCDPRLVDWVAADMSSAPPSIAVEAMEHSISNDGPILAGVPRLTAPLVAINPDNEPNDEESLRNHGVKLVVAQGVGHFLMMEDPESFNRLLAGVIGEFVSRRQAKSTT